MAPAYADTNYSGSAFVSFIKTIIMKLYAVYFLASAMVLGSCNQNVFMGKSHPHKQYEDGLVKAGLQRSRMGTQWINMAQSSLQQPVKINLPYKENGYFAADKPLAKAYLFSLRRGDKLKINVTTNPARGIKLFSDLWQPTRLSANDAPLAVMDTLLNTMQYTATASGDLVVRLQPELLAAVEYTITIITEPSLAFPVQQSGKPKIISLWGVGRDNNTRSHEGIDIAAVKRTPALAVADGYITQVGDNNLGGKVVFMRPAGQSFSVYYAHLDSQLVREGQTVTTGQVIGLVGNTGNAKHTGPHLHFGIYTSGGAIDPLAFVDKDRAQPKEPSGTNTNFDKWLRARKEAVVYATPDTKTLLARLKPGDIVRIQSAAATWYHIMLPDGRTGFIDHGLVTDGVLRKQKITLAKPLLDTPLMNAPAITTIAANNEVEVKGLYNDFMRVKYKDMEGWLGIGQ